MGTALLYGFPNREAYRLGRKLFGYQEVGPIDVLARSLTWARHVRRLVGDGGTARAVGKIHARIHRRVIPAPSHGLQGAEVRKAHGFDARFDRFWAQAYKTFDMIAVRDRRQLEWRYAKKPGAGYTVLTLERGGDLLGYSVLAVRESSVRVGVIADLLTLPEEGIAEHLLASALEHFLDEGLDVAECWSIPGGRYEKAMQKYFPRRLAEPARLALGIWDEAVDDRVAWNITRWHITFGDSDGI